ncbi:glycosyltransferase family 4 protein [Altericroceibacterium endophyticum]|uniref:Glycosyltransferase n=1 Tax=Altericroceibacterium endophyticum TaxID=1808508 RepID=A0A6I4T369_9SPHN|nr:glycosyltransferase family 1 protein [Altericroceibacterium endophyticum]MXO65684.1 glycosyltransferase [Altericroceibacterium endophyticum]
MKIALVTDAWAPQVNGVVRTLQSVRAEIERRGHEVLVVSPDCFSSIPCPTYPEIRLALAGTRSVARMIDQFDAEAVHIATEGPLGMAARRYCLRRKRPFTTAYHTQFPDYLARRTGLPSAMFWPFIRWFHGPSSGVMVATDRVADQLRANGITRLRRWSRGVDFTCFSPVVTPPDIFFDMPRPIQLYVGRVAVEKNIEAFLSNDHPGTKVVVGDGPALAGLKVRFPEACFLGKQSGAELAACYAGADVFVFPSRTDTFGLVMIEALACGTPVAAYPVAGPLDVLDDVSGAMDERLEEAIARALQLKREDCLARAQKFSWDASAKQFLDALEPEDTAPAMTQLYAHAA